MNIARSILEDWYNEHHPGAVHDFGATMVSAPRGRLAAMWRPDCLDTRYPPTDGSADLRSLLAAHEGLEARDLVMTCGATEANAAALLAASEAGGEVVLQDPLYYQFEPLVACSGALPVRWDPFGSAQPPLRPATCLVVLNTPHNPSGRVIDPEPVIRLAEALPRCRVLIDEVYRGVTPGSPGTSALLSPRVVATGSFAKRWGAPGIRLGWLACRDRDFRELAHAWHCYLAHSPPASSERTVVALWPEFQVIEQESRALAARNRALFEAWLAQQADLLQGRPPEAGVMTIVRPLSRGYGGDDLALALALRREAGIFVLPGSAVGYPGWLRLGFGHRDAEELVAGLAALEGALRRSLAAVGAV